MSKRLELLFSNEAGRSVTIGVDEPVEPVDAQVVTQVMDKILENNAFTSAGGPLVEKRGARVVERNVEEIEIEL